MNLQNSTVLANAQSVPGAGMRGGLGRALLTAFLLLSIVPLSLISFVTSTQARRNLQQELEEKLDTIAILTDAQIRNWVTNQQSILAILSDRLVSGPKPDYLSASNTESILSNSVSRFYEELAEIDTADLPFKAWFLVNQQGHVLATLPTAPEYRMLADRVQQQRVSVGTGGSVGLATTSGSNSIQPAALLLSHPISESALTLVALLDPENLIQAVDTAISRTESGEIYLVPPSGQPLELSPAIADGGSSDLANQSSQTPQRSSMAIQAALAGQSGVANYENYQDIKVIGAYRWLPELNMALLAEQPQDFALASSDDLAVVLIGATLAMVLLTALIATVVTRRITLPIVQLTATAVEIAAGDLDQKVSTTRRDEIGILARAFNVMTTKLRVLYEDLEHEVRERTQQLQEANARIRYRAMQLAISAEVGRVVTSILDPDLLLPQVVELIRDCFQAYFVAVYSVDDSGQWAVFQEGSGGLGAQLKAEGHRLELSQDHLIGQTIHNMEPSTHAGASLDSHIDRHLFPHTGAELVVPLKARQRTIGVLDVHSTHDDAFDGDEVMVLEILSGQIAVAIENARVYALERQTGEKLRELEELRRGFLSNMSRELRMPLNNIIGFSRVILKGIDGPITDLQHEDLSAIHESGQQLLVLINDILDVAQIEAGEMELDVRPVDFGEIARSVIPTANALLQGRPIQFHHDIYPDLPLVLADAHRLRQVLIKLLSNAAKFTQEGEIALRVWFESEQIVATVMDTGITIQDIDREKIFEAFRQLSQFGQTNSRGTGLGLRFSKEIVEMHGGTIWLEKMEEKGTIFTITIPIFKPENNLE